MLSVLKFESNMFTLGCNFFFSLVLGSIPAW